MSLEGAYARAEGIVIKPTRVGLWCVNEEVTKQLRRVPHTVVVLLHPGADELVDLGLR